MAWVRLLKTNRSYILGSLLTLTSADVGAFTSKTVISIPDFLTKVTSMILAFIISDPIEPLFWAFLRLITWSKSFKMGLIFQNNN
jgi:hypothetical protein